VNPCVLERLSALSRHPEPFVRALWIETLAPEEALSELFGRSDGLSLLQKARFLLELGRAEDAEQVLGDLEDLPAGLAALREEILTGLQGPADVPPAADMPGVLASATLAALHARQGDREAAIAMFRAVLARDPNDAQARDGLRELTGVERGGPDQALGAWLQRVRHWRTEHGV